MDSIARGGEGGRTKGILCVTVLVLLWSVVGPRMPLSGDLRPRGGAIPRGAEQGLELGNG